FETAHDGWVDLHAVSITRITNKLRDLKKVVALCADTDEIEHLPDVAFSEFSTFREVAALVLASGAKKLCDALLAETIKLVDCTQHGELLLGVFRNFIQQLVERLPAV